MVDRMGWRRSWHKYNLEQQINHAHLMGMAMLSCRSPTWKGWVSILLNLLILASKGTPFKHATKHYIKHYTGYSLLHYTTLR